VRRLRRVVFDTSTLLGAAMRVGSIPYQAMVKALATCDVCASIDTLEELRTVFAREKFERYLPRELRLEFVTSLSRKMRLFVVPELEVGLGCRDTKDDKFLALVMAAEADALVSSDEDLLVMDPWRGVQVLTAAQFLAAD